MKSKNNILLAFIFLALIPGCKSKPLQEYEYTPLEEYKFEKADIQPGTPVTLLAFSGGKRNDPDNLYYYQFIVKTNTNDTIRILTPLISIDESTGAANKTYTTPLQYNPDKGILEASYQLKDSTHNLLLNLESSVNNNQVENLENIENMDDLGSLMNNGNKKHIVEINKSFPEFVNPNYRTAVGILHFKDMPW